MSELSELSELGELGVEVGGDFGDLLEDLESFVFEVDGAEADGLELAQDAGDFAGPWWKRLGYRWVVRPTSVTITNANGPWAKRPIQPSSPQPV